MPVYAYHCRECDNDFEVKQSFHDEPLSDCQVCGSPDSVFRVIQPAGIVFKGSGWYITDSRSSSNGSLPAAKSNGHPSANGSNGAGDSGGSNDAGGGDGSRSESATDASAASSSATSAKTSSSNTED